MKYNPLPFVVSFLILISCTKKETQENIPCQVLSINVESDKLRTEEPALPNFRYVKLETKEECLLEDVIKITPYNNKLFILSSSGKGNVYVFDDKGNYLYQIKKGEGPENIMYPTDITINEEKKSLVILDAYRNIKEYDPETGQFLKKTIMKDPFFSIETIGNDFLLFDPNSRKQSDFYLRYLSNEKEYKDLFPKPIKGSFFSLPNFFTKITPREVLVSCIFSDTIFSINNTQQELSPYIVFNFQGKEANNPRNLEGIESLGKYLDNAKERKLVTGPCDVCSFNGNLFFTLKGENNYFVTYDSKENKVLLHKTLFEGLPNMYTSVGRTEKEVIYAIDMPWLMEYFTENPPTNSEIIKQLKQECNNTDDNPVLLFGSF
ncbi:6-bladed beta-propeller [Parabacteroides pacaensis]|uniref:6-bladed beta-propeller n=1 Tax=Parabacteroides pacaensis TaxID=2086575 RepID=UPI000D0F7EA2|nr:6-bladed beta-propeller [Parabacteroides pacaensis]